VADGHLVDVLIHAYRLGFEQAVSGDEVFGRLVLARIIEPTSKLDSLRVLSEAGFRRATYATVKCRLPGSPGTADEARTRRRTYSA